MPIKIGIIDKKINAIKEYLNIIKKISKDKTGGFSDEEESIEKTAKMHNSKEENCYRRSDIFYGYYYDWWL